MIILSGIFHFPQLIKNDRQNYLFEIFIRWNIAKVSIQMHETKNSLDFILHTVDYKQISPWNEMQPKFYFYARFGSNRDSRNLEICKFGELTMPPSGFN